MSERAISIMCEDRTLSVAHVGIDDKSCEMRFLTRLPLAEVRE